MANTYVWKIADLNRDLSDGFTHTYNSGAYDSHCIPCVLMAC